MAMRRFPLTKPGLFVCGTDTAVGKTVVTCAIARRLRAASWRVGVCKPMASGCVEQDGELVNDDALLLREHARCDDAMSIINPLRFAPPLAPAAASDQSPDWQVVAHSLKTLDRQYDGLLIEGVGGLLVPLDANDPQLTVLDLIRAIGYPTLVVTRPGLGTLNHTAMTVRLLRESGCRVAGLVISGMPADADDDPSLTSNRRWMEKMNGVAVLGVVPRDDSDPIVAAYRALATVHWPDVLSAPSSGMETSSLSD
jgi:dethiobiotin synthetase